MSWHFSRVLEAAFSRASCSAGQPSAQSNSTPIAPDDSCSAKMKATFHRSPFGTMFVPSMDTLGLAVLTWWREASPAPTFPPQARRLESRERPAASGWKWPGSFAKYDPDSSSWKTRQHLLTEGSAEFSATWPEWGSMRDGECSDLTMLAPITAANGPGSWPTPCHGSSHWGGTFQEVGGSGNKLRKSPIGKLYVNPDFWESLMGWPIGWTGTAPLATAKTLEWQQQYGKS
jgi:hypothetical protein